MRAAAAFYDYREFLSRQFDAARELFERVAPEGAMLRMTSSYTRLSNRK